MLFTVLQTQNIGVLLFNIVHGRISGRLYESFGVLKPRKKSFLVNKNSEKKNPRKQWIHAITRDFGKNFSVSNSTQVFSRHFKAEVFKTTLTHEVS